MSGILYQSVSDLHTGNTFFGANNFLPPTEELLHLSANPHIFTCFICNSSLFKQDLVYLFTGSGYYSTSRFIVFLRYFRWHNVILLYCFIIIYANKTIVCVFIIKKVCILLGTTFPFREPIQKTNYKSLTIRTSFEVKCNQIFSCNYR